MRLLTRAQLLVRLIVFAGFSLLFTVAVWVTELAITSYEGITAWAAFAVFLGVASLLSVMRWRTTAIGDAQEEWQPALMLRVLGGGLAFQAGVVGYFVANDVMAASIGCAAFFFVLGFAMASLRSVEFSA